MNKTLKSSYRMLWRAFKRAMFETANTVKQNFKAIVYMAKSEGKREERRRLERIYMEAIEGDNG